jgi:DNA-binding transcriptional ArsR family regulator
MSATEVHPSDRGTHTVPNTTDEPELSKDKIFHLLQTPRRRYVLQYLKEHEGTVEMRDIAEQVAVWENETSVQALTSDERQRVYIPLYQSHLPKLDEEGIIEYNQSRGTVKRTKLADQLDRYLTADEVVTNNVVETERERPWGTYYFGTSLFSTLLLAGSVLGMPVLATLPSVAIGGAIVAMFSFITLAQVMVEEKRVP